MNKDTVDEILEQWTDERPELDTASLGVVIRIMSLNRLFAREATAALESMDIELFEYDVVICSDISIHTTRPITA